SSTMRSKNAPCGSSSCTSEKTAYGSIASRSTDSGCRILRRYSLMKACLKIVISQAFALVPFSYWSPARYALSIVSWTRSSASDNNLDTPIDEGLSDFADELLVKRLGLSTTVPMQLAEFEQLVRKDARVEPSHVEALLRLVGRRPDADLVFAAAGRRAARRGVKRMSWVSRLFGHRAARRAARTVPGAELPRAPRPAAAPGRSPLP